MLHADHIGALGLVAVGGAEHVQVGHGAQGVQHLHGLVSGAILACRKGPQEAQEAEAEGNTVHS